ncbi:hypothetical protein EST38_g6784 [Candolleomyces aberdarensis]|uniref:Uncharacterized protein n=1 Tax=Candolleomyces aberdarensis TaxID=2316362 RepID=A0A4Q2DK53_9AGAR|nr:hypothetical protein EST38_g6784 [Candolleomyces aberdarensis]
MDELVELIRHRLWRDGKSVRYWLRKIREYRDMAWDAAREEDKEFAYVYAFKAAVLIFDKMPKLEDFRGLVSPQQQNNLAEHGHQLIELITQLTPQLRQEYDDWIQQERLRIDAVEAVRSASKAPAEATAAAPSEASEAAPAQESSSAPSGPPPEYDGGSMQLEVETEKQRQLRLSAADISRPGTPVSHDTPIPAELLSGPPPSSPITATRRDLKDDDGDGYNDSDNCDYGESHWAGGRLPSYNEVLEEILQEGPTGAFSSSAAATLSPDYREDNGSDYNIEVVEPDVSREATPQPEESPVDEKKQLKRREEQNKASDSEPVAIAQLSPSLSRRSSISKDKTNNSGTRDSDSRNADPSSAQAGESFDLKELEKALDKAKDQLKLLKSSGAPIPAGIKQKIVELSPFLV